MLAQLKKAILITEFRIYCGYNDSTVVVDRIHEIAVYYNFTSVVVAVDRIYTSCSHDTTQNTGTTRSLI